MANVKRALTAGGLLLATCLAAANLALANAAIPNTTYFGYITVSASGQTVCYCGGTQLCKACIQ